MVVDLIAVVIIAGYAIKYYNKGAWEGLPSLVGLLAITYIIVLTDAYKLLDFFRSIVNLSSILGHSPKAIILEISIYLLAVYVITVIVSSILIGDPPEKLNKPLGILVGILKGYVVSILLAIIVMTLILSISDFDIEGISSHLLPESVLKSIPETLSMVIEGGI